MTGKGPTRQLMALPYEFGKQPAHGLACAHCDREIASRRLDRVLFRDKYGRAEWGFEPQFCSVTCFMAACWPKVTDDERFRA